MIYLCLGGMPTSGVVVITMQVVKWVRSPRLVLLCVYVCVCVCVFVCVVICKIPTMSIV